MDGPVFDAMLKTALEEALQLDVEETPAKAVRPSARHRRRMRRMLKDPWGYVRCDGAGKRRGHLLRYLAVFAAVVVLTGTAAGYALSGGGLFREMFDASPWADAYGDAADTEQLLDMGGELETTVVESNGLRFEMLDAVSDGQMAMVSVRLTILEKFDQLRLSRGGLNFDEMRIVSEDSQEIQLYGLAVSRWDAEPSMDLKPGQFSLLFTLNDLSLSAGGTYEIYLKDVTGKNGKTVLPGEWTLMFTLHPAKVLELHPKHICKLDGVEWELEHLTVSPLALTMDFHHISGTWDHKWAFLEHLAVNLQNGQKIDDCSMGGSGNDSQISLTVEFHMPMDVSQIQSVTICGEEIPLTE